MKDITQLLKKKKLTGEEVGKLLIASLIHAYRQSLDGNSNIELFSNADFKQALKSLDTSEDFRKYNLYVGLNNFLQQYQGIALAHAQQLEGHIKSILNALLTARAVEETRSYIADMPVIMTEKQYSDFKAQKVQEHLLDENGEPLNYNVFNLLEEAMRGLIAQLNSNPRAKNPLKPIKKKYQRAKVTSERILSRYNVVMGEGYYTLEDGRRSDQMTAEEWQEAIATPKMKEMPKALNEYRETHEQNETLTDLMYERIDQEAIISKARILYNGGSVEDAEKADRKIEERLGYSMPAKWKYYSEPPEDLTKWDILELDDLGSFYPALYGEWSDTSEFLDQLKDFIAEFKELVDAVIADIDSKYFKGEKGLAVLPLEEWETTLFDFKQLYEKDFYNFRAWLEDDTTAFDGNYRAIFNGIAILKQGSFNTHKLDDNGYFVDPAKQAIGFMSASFGLEQYTQENPDYLQRVDELEEAQELIKSDFKWLYAYDTAIDLTAKEIDMPDLALFKSGVGELAKKMDAINDLIPMLYKSIKSTFYDNKAEQARKLEVLEDVLTPIKYKCYQTPPADRLAKAKEAVQGLKVYETQTGELIDILAEYEDSELDDAQNANGEGV